MKKRILCLTLIIVLLFSVSSCRHAKAELNFDAHELSTVDCLSEIRKIYSLDDFVQKNFIRQNDYYGMAPNVSSYKTHYTLEELNETFPVEYIYKLCDNAVAVYKVSDSDKKEFYLHLFFEFSETADPNDDSANMDKNNWRYVPRYLISSVNKSKYTKEAVYEGMEIKKLADIFPETNKYIPLDDTYLFKFRPNPSFATFVTENGFVKIEFEIKESDEKTEYIVSDVEYIEYSQVQKIYDILGSIDPADITFEKIN